MQDKRNTSISICSDSSFTRKASFSRARSVVVTFAVTIALAWLRSPPARRPRRTMVLLCSRPTAPSAMARTAPELPREKASKRPTFVRTPFRS